MHKNLYTLAKEYINIIEKIEEMSDTKKIQLLDEKRAILHGEFIDLLKEQGIKYKDRDHVTRIAFRIAKEEL